MSERLHIQAYDSHYLTVALDATVTAVASSADDSQVFEIVGTGAGATPSRNGDHVRLRTLDGRLMSLRGGRLQACVLDTEAESDITLVIPELGSLGARTRFSLKTPYGRYVSVEDRSHVLNAARRTMDNCAMFTADLVPETDNWLVSLRTHDHRHLLQAQFVKDMAANDPGARPDLEISDQDLLKWIRQGHHSEIPFYLELLASPFAAGRCPKLDADRPRTGQLQRATELAALRVRSSAGTDARRGLVSQPRGRRSGRLAGTSSSSGA